VIRRPFGKHLCLAALRGGGDESDNGTRLLEAGSPLMWLNAQNPNQSPDRRPSPRLLRDRDSRTGTPYQLYSQRSRSAFS
jgi:hypothetical protein